MIIGGQTLALLLTLIATPVAYSLFDDMVEWKPFAKVAGLFSRKNRRQEEPAAV